MRTGTSGHRVETRAPIQNSQTMDLGVVEDSRVKSPHIWVCPLQGQNLSTRFISHFPISGVSGPGLSLALDLTHAEQRWASEVLWSDLTWFVLREQNPVGWSVCVIEGLRVCAPFQQKTTVWNTNEGPHAQNPLLYELKKFSRKCFWSTLDMNNIEIQEKSIKLI